MRTLVTPLFIALARLHLWRYRPQIIGVTGNVGKSSTKEAIGAVMSSTRRVRVGKGNLNTELGIALNILGDWGEAYYESSGNPFFWMKVFVWGCWGLVRNASYPDILVLEYGADAPGNIRDLVRLFPPHVGVVTAIGDIPVHIEFFDGKEAVAQEKAHLVSGLPAAGHAILNHDDPLVFDMKEKTKAHIRTYGFHEHAGVRVGGVEIVYDDRGVPTGTRFKIHHGPNAYVPVLIEGWLGASQAYSSAAATAVGLIYGMHLIDIAEALSQRYRGPKGRLRLLQGIRSSTVIDDTYNAAPLSTQLALETLHEVKAPRRIAVLGDMLELGEHTIPAHQAVGNLAAQIADVCVFVGPRMKFAYEAALNQKLKESLLWFGTSSEAIDAVAALLREGDVAVVKGSQGMRMEKIVAGLLAEPGQAAMYLVRHSSAWLAR